MEGLSALGHAGLPFGCKWVAVFQEQLAPLVFSSVVDDLAALMVPT